jgi:hypothetical protein
LASLRFDHREKLNQLRLKPGTFDLSHNHPHSGWND